MKREPLEQWRVLKESYFKIMVINCICKTKGITFKMLFYSLKTKYLKNLTIINVT